jgi:hypothetical protein
MSNETTITIAGNLVDDPRLQFTTISREFAISEVLVGLNRGVDRRG